MDSVAKRKKRIGMLVAALVCGVVFISLGFDSPLNPFRQWPPRNSDIHVCETGAWGRLWYERSVIEIPPERIRVLSFKPQPTRWYIEPRSSAELTETLQSCGMEAAQIQDLLLTMTRASNGVGRILSPSPELVLSLSESVRLKLYTVLGRYAANGSATWPFRFSGAPTDNWFEGACLDPEIEKLVRSLIYHHGQSQMFSDLDLVMSRYPSAEVYSNLFQVLSRESTLVARVKILPGDDVDALARYWGVPDRAADVRTLLRTMQMTEDCRDVPVTQLLPGFARNRMYRYWHEGDPEFASCHYTAMNFLNAHADGRFTNLTEVARTLATDYVEVNQDYRLGDVMLLMKNETEAIHSCNYIADGIVFTRNGGSFAQPWMLTTLTALLDFYSYPDPVHVKVLRRRDIARQ